MKRPPHPGDYVLGNPEGTVAVGTLSNRELPHRLITAGEPALAIAGRCDTEQRGLILCEHYENNGRLAHVIQDRRAALIAATLVERGLVTQLDHAAYLGRELQKAEAALSAGIAHEQDAAQGPLNRFQEEGEPTNVRAIKPQ